MSNSDSNVVGGIEAKTFLDYIRATLGTKNWIVGRRTPRNEIRYGDDAIFITADRFREIKADYLATVREHA